MLLHPLRTPYCWHSAQAYALRAYLGLDLDCCISGLDPSSRYCGHQSSTCLTQATSLTCSGNLDSLAAWTPFLVHSDLESSFQLQVDDAEVTFVLRALSLWARQVELYSNGSAQLSRHAMPLSISASLQMLSTSQYERYIVCYQHDINSM